MENRINNFTREAKIGFLKKLRADDPNTREYMYQMMSTEDLLKRLFKILLPWMKAKEFQDVESLEEAIRKEGLRFNDRLCQDAFEFYKQENSK